MACPRCGGLDRVPVAPGLWRCTTTLSRSSVAGLDDHGAPLFTQQSFQCGTGYPEGPPPERGSATCEYCTTFAVGTCADCQVWVCGAHSAMSDGQRVCDRCREVRTYSRLVSVGDFLAAARAQGNPGVRTWRVATSFKDPHVVRARGLHPHDRIEFRQARDLREVQGWTRADRDNSMLGTDGREHQLLESGASWHSSPQVASTWYRVYGFARQSIQDRTAMVRANADRDGVDLTALATRTPEQAREDWADQDQADARAEADLIARAWSAWDAFVADGSFDRHAQDLYSLHRWEPMFGKTATEVSVAERAVRIGEIGAEFNFNSSGDRTSGPGQMCLTKDQQWVTLSGRRMQTRTDRFDSQFEVASRMLERLQALGWTGT